MFSTHILFKSSNPFSIIKAVFLISFKLKGLFTRFFNIVFTTFTSIQSQNPLFGGPKLGQHGFRCLGATATESYIILGFFTIQNASDEVCPVVHCIGQSDRSAWLDAFQRVDINITYKCPRSYCSLLNVPPLEG